MIEGWSDNIEQAKFVDALEFGTERAINVSRQIQSMKLEKTVKEPKIDKSFLSACELAAESESAQSPESESELELESEPSKKINVDEYFQKLAHAKLYDVLTDYEHDKLSRDNALSQIRNLTVNAILKSPVVANNPSTYTYTSLSEHFYKYVRKMVRNLALQESKRVDGRKLDELRPISCRADLFKSLHGSALFQRGQTQVLCSVTFDSPDSMYRAEAIPNMMSPSLTNFNKNFMLHYEFPAFATNEIARVGGRADRREIGHGALAGKAAWHLSSQ